MHALIILLLLVLVSGETISLKNDGNVVNGIKRRVIKAEELHNFLRNKKIGGGNNLFQENFLLDAPWIEFYAGTPATYYLLRVETGFNSLWFIDPSYEGLQPYQQPYDQKNSTTSKAGSDWQFGYSGQYGLYGPSFTDTVNDTSNTWSQRFGSIQNVFLSDNAVAPEIPLDGIIGLAWDPNEEKKKLNETSSAILHMLKGKPEQIVSIWQKREVVPGFGIVYDFFLGVGYMDKSLCSPDINYIPLQNDLDRTLLSFRVNGFKFGSYETKRSGVAKVDTGISVIFLPTGPYGAVYKQLKPEYDWNLHIFTTDCSNADVFKDWSFKINGVDYALSAKDYVVDISLPQTGKCVLAFELSTEFYVDYGFGNPFGRRYCCFHDVEKNRLGLSNALDPCLNKEQRDN